MLPARKAQTAGGPARRPWRSALGGPRGLLRLYILHSLSRSPMSGYDLISELNAATSGSWHPGSGSVYPVFKWLEESGLIRVSSRGRRSKQLYSLTPAGEEALESDRYLFNEFATKWSRIRRMMLDWLSAENLAALLNDGVRTNAESWSRVMESKEMTRAEKAFRLKEYALLLEKELGSTRRRLKDLG